MPEGENLPKHDYVTPDGRWRVRRNLNGCAPRSWWDLRDTTNGWGVQVKTLGYAKRFIADILADELEDDDEVFIPEL